MFLTTLLPEFFRNLLAWTTAISTFVASVGCDFLQAPTAEEEKTKRTIRQHVAPENHCPSEVKVFIAIYITIFTIFTYIDDADPVQKSVSSG
ncbi:hypothetical protein ETB97_001334 [Aspergillus alliaceus]|uniref:Uncharacterized protein n=1 Tax=Petromyces alliaceus TaxID=209559 RepID=A0A8H6A693_PETAA|nr:hypothetical protein ETB97_001334 [Aspergillus burnettii]